MYRKIANCIQENSNYKDTEVLEFGLRLFVGSIANILVLLAIAWFFNVLLETISAFVAGALLRIFTGGAHARTQAKCIVVGSLIYLAIGLLVNNLAPIIQSQGLVMFYLAVIFLFAFYTVYKRAPVEAENKPITSQIQREKLRKISLAVLTILLVISVVFSFVNLTTALALGAGVLWQCISLYSFTYKLLKSI